ncbi:MAG: hypothetical protein KA764_00340 [Anaerolineales bacterium]|nr:hypothetical protein [Anaerolineales bacterium]
MYPVQGAPPPPPLQKADDNALGLRLNQRLVAEVLQIAADHVVLGLEGVPVVARLTSPEQAALLAERRAAQFVVRGLSDQGLVLQLQTAGPGAAPAPPAPELLPALLQQAQRPATPANLLIAQALLNQNLPVTAELMDELAGALNGVKDWGGPQAQTAAGAKAAGLPLSPGALDLLTTASDNMGGTLNQLQAQLRALIKTALPPRLAELTQTALALVNGLPLEASPSAPELAAQLRNWVAAAGRSLEHALAGPPAAANPAETGLLALTQLRQALTQAAPARPEWTALTHSLDQFLEAARLEQFRNVAPLRPPPDGRWLSLHLPVRQPAGENAQLRVAYQTNGGGDTINPRHTRLTLVFPVTEASTMQIDLMVIDHQIGAWLTASDEALRGEAEAELPDLATGLATLGFSLKTARCEVGQPALAPEPADTPRPAPAHRINVKA